MKTSTLLALAAGKLVAGHATFQSFVIGGKDQGQHFAVQTPSNGNNPILDVTSTAMNCNGGKATADQVEVAAGSEITFQWHHNDGAPTAGDNDEPIAASHKGPVMVYIADAASNGEGAVWQKIFEEGLSGGKWAVDKFITNKGAITIKLPNLAAGNYLIRPEIIALHEASAVGKAQFYNGCGQIKVTGSGSVKLPAAGTDMTKAYSATDAGVKFDIYSGATTYPIPGPKLFSGSDASEGSTPADPAPAPSAPASSAPATTAAPAPSASASAPATQPKPTTTLITSAKPAPTSGSGSGAGAAVAKWGQCGGKEYKGATACADSWVCKEWNPYYSQCVQA
ncbi:carbohydrate-binding module family 1 protein [Periconia macrospinosa]|uniref:AA9 family lytic polysaccharide monooxygenase n=1 Tax=Periconia macrospinosa TaxID=97972 RepID=A0A2V1DBG3_9PLEO|nr:carbohydrate-binding module family 1 protein [Periconia macrospinosa]